MLDSERTQSADSFRQNETSARSTPGLLSSITISTIMNITKSGIVAILALTIAFAHSRTANAENAWRCTIGDCDDVLVNDIEDRIKQDWPASLSLQMPPVHATCADRIEACPHCLAGATHTFSIGWSLTLTGTLRSFLFGRYTADTNVFAQFKTAPTRPNAGIQVVEESWNDTAIAHSFDAASAQIPAVGDVGSTEGVQDLGGVRFTTPSGTFWSSSLHVAVEMDSYQWCKIGSETFDPGRGGGTHIFSIPWTSLPVADILAESLRNQFRRAVRLTVAGGSQVSEFADWAHASHARAISGDFNGDRRTDIALVGGDGWPMIPVAFSNGDGSFSVTATPVADFSRWANLPGVQVVAGDVNGDGRADLIAAGGPGWTTLPVALSNGDGSFTVLNKTNAQFPVWSTITGAKLLAGDVNHDGRSDLLLVSGLGWSTIPVAFSNGDGTFAVTNETVSSFPIWAQSAGAKMTIADINRDGRADIILTGANGSTVSMAISQGDGRFQALSRAEPSISQWSQSPGVTLLSGDVDGIGGTDILLTGGAGWSTIPVGLAKADGAITVTNPAVPDFPGWAQNPAAQAVSGDFNADGLTDLALVGGAGWWTVPVAFSTGSLTFTISNVPIQ